MPRHSLVLQIYDAITFHPSLRTAADNATDVCFDKVYNVIDNLANFLDFIATFFKKNFFHKNFVKITVYTKKYNVQKHKNMQFC